MVPEYEARFMELLRYALYLNTEKLKVNRFMFGLNRNLRAKVRILMPQTLHNVVQKALIAEEELISGVRPGLQRDQQGRSHLEHNNTKHQRDIHRGIVASRVDPLSLHPGDHRLSSGHLIGDHSINNTVSRSSNSLSLFSSTNQGSRPVGCHLLL
jgi:hypothetical protein